MVLPKRNTFKTKKKELTNYKKKPRLKHEFNFRIYFYVSKKKKLISVFQISNKFVGFFCNLKAY